MTSIVDFSCSYSLLAALREAGFPRDRIYRAMAALYDSDDESDVHGPENDEDFVRRMTENEDWDEDLDELDDPSHVDGEEPLEPPCELEEEPYEPEPEDNDEPYEPTPEDWMEYELWSEQLEYERRFSCNARFV